MGSTLSWRAKVLVPVALVLVCMLPLVSASAAQKIALSAGTFAFEVDAGETGNGEIVVINDGDEPINVLVYTADVEIDETGDQTYPLPERTGGGLATTPASWFRIFMPADSKSIGNTPYLEMEPGDRIPVKFDFTPPANTAPGDHNTMIFFEMFDFAPSSEGAAAQVSSRIGARVAVRVNGDVVEKMSIRPFEVPEFSVGTLVPYEFTIVNEGNLNKVVQANVSVLDRSEREVVSSVVASDTTVYAQSNQLIAGQIDTVAGRIGPHTVEVEVEYFEEGAQLPSVVVEQRTIWLFPLWLLLAAAVLVFVGAVLLAARLMRGRRSERGERRGSQSRGDARRRAREDRSVVVDASEGNPGE